MTNQIQCPQCRTLVDLGRFCLNCSAALPSIAYPAFREGLNHAKYLAACHRIYGMLSAAVTILSAILALLGVFLSSLIPAILRTLLGQALFEKWFGATSSNWIISTIVYVARFGPIVLAIFSVLVTVLIGLAFTIPFFATARGIRRQEGWTKVMGTIAVILSIAVFPLGTVLSLYTLWYLFLSPDQNRFMRQWGR